MKLYVSGLSVDNTGDLYVRGHDILRCIAYGDHDPRVADVMIGIATMNMSECVVCVLCANESGIDRMRQMVEIGCAIGMGRQVHVVITNPWDTAYRVAWMYHPGVHIYPSWDTAVTSLK